MMLLLLLLFLVVVVCLFVDAAAVVLLLVFCFFEIFSTLVNDVGHARNVFARRSGKSGEKKQKNN